MLLLDGITEMRSGGCSIPTFLPPVLDEPRYWRRLFVLRMGRVVRHYYLLGWLCFGRCCVLLARRTIGRRHT